MSLYSLDLSSPDDLGVYDALFVGFARETGVPVASGNEQSIAVLGLPGSGKTSGILIPQALLWAGSLVSASTSPDVLRATRGRRLEIAKRRGGDVFVYAPEDPDTWVHGARNVGWVPTSGCQNATTCTTRVQAMLGPKPSKDDSGNAGFFYSNATQVLQAYFHAAALGAVPFSEVLDWIASYEVKRPASLIRERHGHLLFASQLERLGSGRSASIDDTFSSVSQAMMSITVDPAVIASCERDELDIDRFIDSASSLYVVSPGADQDAASLPAALIETIADRLIKRARVTRFDPPMLLLLDEVANIAPLPKLHTFITTGRKHGLLCTFAIHSLHQLKARWGESNGRVIWEAVGQKILFGGVEDKELMEGLSALLGEHKIIKKQRTVPQHNIFTVLSSVATKQPGALPSDTYLEEDERNFKAEKIFGQPPGQSLIIVSSGTDKVTGVWLDNPPAAMTREFGAVIEIEAAFQRSLELAPVTAAIKAPAAGGPAPSPRIRIKTRIRGDESGRPEVLPAPAAEIATGEAPRFRMNSRSAGDTSPPDAGPEPSPTLPGFRIKTKRPT